MDDAKKTKAVELMLEIDGLGDQIRALKNQRAVKQRELDALKKPAPETPPEAPAAE